MQHSQANVSIRLDSQEETTSGDVARFFKYLIYIWSNYGTYVILGANFAKYERWYYKNEGWAVNVNFDL